MAICIQRKPNESIDSLLRRFKTKVKESGILKEFFDAQYFEKKSKIKKEKKRLSIQRMKKSNLTDF